jgi:hypothetical protein
MDLNAVQYSGTYPERCFEQPLAYVETPEHFAASPEHVPSCGLEALRTVAQGRSRVMLPPSMSLLNHSWYLM